MFQAMISKNTNMMRKYINPSPISDQKCVRILIAIALSLSTSFRIIGDGCCVVAIGDLERRRSRSDEARSTNHH
jgi:hypothetical protein